MKSPIVIRIVAPNDARGWIGFGCFVLVLIVLGMIALDKTLLDNNAFLVLATAIVITGWANGPVGWAYQATKGGGEAAESTARIAEEAATAAIKTAARPARTVMNEPQNVTVVNPPDDPVQTEEAKS